MTPEEHQFLLAEFNQAWLLVNAIDERRGKFLQSVTAMVIATVGAVGFLISGDKPALPLNRTVEACALVAVTILACLWVMAILLSERAANVRYRKKANVIRSLFLARSPIPAVQDYLTCNKDLGVLIPGDTQEPKGVGNTLFAMFVFLALQVLGLFLTLGYVIARYHGHFSG